MKNVSRCRCVTSVYELGLCNHVCESAKIFSRFHSTTIVTILVPSLLKMSTRSNSLLICSVFARVKTLQTLSIFLARACIMLCVQIKYFMHFLKSSLNQYIRRIHCFQIFMSHVNRYENNQVAYY